MIGIAHLCGVNVNPRCSERSEQVTASSWTFYTAALESCAESVVHQIRYSSCAPSPFQKLGSLFDIGWIMSFAVFSVVDIVEWRQLYFDTATDRGTSLQYFHLLFLFATN